MVSTAVERDSRVELAEVPSAKWGWSRINHRTWHITGLVVAVFLVAMMLFRNHGDHTSDSWLIGFAVLVLVAIALSGLR